MSDNYFDDFTPVLEAMTKTFEQYREISKQLAENIISPLIEFQKRIAEITEPLAEFQKNIATIVAPLTEYTKVLSAIKLFSQSISAYNRNQYHLAIMGLLGIVDGLLSDISEKSGTHIESRAKTITDKLSNNIELSYDDFSIWFLYSTFTDIIKSIGASAPFDGEEPELLNRHWIMHGRTKKKISQLDYIKIINFIYGILLFNKISNEEMESDNG